jgi:hypothetical protein
LRAELREEVSMKPVRELFEEALTFQATGAEPSEIARRIIEIAHASGHVIVNETSSAADVELGFSGNEKIRWDGREWRFYAN